MAIDWENLHPHARRVIEGIVERHNEEQKKLKPVREHLEDPRRYSVEEIINIADTYQIAKIRRHGSDEVEYAPYVNFKPVGDWAESLDLALLIAIAYKRTKSTDAAAWAAKLLDI